MKREQFLLDVLFLDDKPANLYSRIHRIKHPNENRDKWSIFLDLKKLNSENFGKLYTCDRLTCNAKVEIQVSKQGGDILVVTKGHSNYFTSLQERIYKKKAKGDVQDLENQLL